MVKKGFYDILLESGRTVESQQGDKRKNEEVSVALKHWQKAAHEWSEIYRRFNEEPGSMLFERKRQLRAQ